VRQTLSHSSLTIKRITRLEKSFQELILEPERKGNHETFIATLIALAMVYADWFTVTFLVAIVAIISFGSLFYVAGTFS